MQNDRKRIPFLGIKNTKIKSNALRSMVKAMKEGLIAIATKGPKFKPEDIIIFDGKPMTVASLNDLILYGNAFYEKGTLKRIDPSKINLQKK